MCEVCCRFVRKKDVFCWGYVLIFIVYLVFVMCCCCVMEGKIESGAMGMGFI